MGITYGFGAGGFDISFTMRSSPVDWTVSVKCDSAFIVTKKD
jgi:hypothetical protein